MRIAGVGSGNMSGPLGQRVAAAGHRLIFRYSRAPAKLEPVAPEERAYPKGPSGDRVWSSEPDRDVP